MANLYEIDAAIMACVDNDTGEIIDPAALDNLLMQRDAKLESVALWIKNLQADALALKSEKESFAAREKAAEKRIEGLKQYLTAALQGKKFSTTKVSVSFRKSTRLDVTDTADIPREYLTETVTIKPNADAIKAAIKAGIEIDGCSLVECQNVQIK